MFEVQVQVVGEVVVVVVVVVDYVDWLEWWKMWKCVSGISKFGWLAHAVLLHYEE